MTTFRGLERAGVRVGFAGCMTSLQASTSHQAKLYDLTYPQVHPHIYKARDIGRPTHQWRSSNAFLQIVCLSMHIIFSTTFFQRGITILNMLVRGWVCWVKPCVEGEEYFSLLFN